MPNSCHAHGQHNQKFFGLAQGSRELPQASAGPIRETKKIRTASAWLSRLQWLMSVQKIYFSVARAAWHLARISGGTGCVKFHDLAVGSPHNAHLWQSFVSNTLLLFNQMTHSVSSSLQFGMHVCVAWTDIEANLGAQEVNRSGPLSLQTSASKPSLTTVKSGPAAHTVASRGACLPSSYQSSPQF